jgi:hypothetical protein
MGDGQQDLSPITYVIRIRGHLDPRWAEWFYDLVLTHESDGTTTLCGPLQDHTALHSVLDRIRDMNLSLISVCSTDDVTHTESESQAQDETPTMDEPPTGANGGATAG